MNYLRVLLLMLVCGVAAVSHAEIVEQNGYQYGIEPTPAWVESQALPSQAPAPSLGMRQWLQEWQLNWQEAEPVRYLRLVREVVATNGIAAVAKYQLEFDPNYQTLSIHALRVKRGGQWSDRAHGKTIELLRRESNLDSSDQYDGSVTLSINLPDVRVGDTVELAYSVKGSNPVFSAGRSTTVPLALDFPVGRLAVKVLAKENAELFYKAFSATVAIDYKKESGARVLRLVRDQVPAVVYEDKAPNSVFQYPFLQIATYRDWAQVSQWGEALFNLEPPKSEEFKQKVAELKLLKTNPERIAAALNFVQEDIRYFGVEIASNSHQPYPPDQVIQQRFGDCKDKTLLLHSLLKALGIRSTPTLASISFGFGLDQLLASPTLFDHAILRVEEGGITYWLDSTITGQGKNLETVGAFDYGFVLPLTGHPLQLTRMVLPRQQSAKVEITEVWKTTDLSARAEVSFETLFSYEEAERFRRRLKSEGAERMQELWLDYMKKRYPLTQSVSRFEVEDDLNKNQIRTRERYQLEDAFTYANNLLAFDIQANDLFRAVTLPEKSGRKYPLLQDTSIEYAYHYQLDSPFILQLAARNKSVPGPYFDFTETGSGKSGHIELNLNLKPLQKEIPVNEVPAYIKQVKAIREGLQKTYSINISDPERFQDLREQARQQYAGLRPVSWRETLVKGATSRAIYLQLLRQYKPSPLIESELLASLAWAELDIGMPQQAQERIARMRQIQTVDNSDLEQLDAVTSAYMIKPEAALQHFTKYRSLATREDLWNDARTEGFIYLTGAHPEKALPVLENALNNDSKNQVDLARWYALSLRLAYSAGTPAVQKWAATGFAADGDAISYDLLLKKSNELDDMANVLRVTNPEAAMHLWLTCGLEAQKNGQLSAARVLYQKIIDTRLAIVPQYNLAQGLLAKLPRR